MEIRLSNLVALEKREQHFVHSIELSFPCKGLLVKVTSMLRIFLERYIRFTIVSTNDPSMDRSNVNRTSISSNWELQFSRHACCSRFTWNLITDVARMRIDPLLFSSNCSPIFGQREAERRRFEHFSQAAERGHEILQRYRTEADASPHKYAGERCVGEEIYRSKEFRIIH